MSKVERSKIAGTEERAARKRVMSHTRRVNKGSALHVIARQLQRKSVLGRSFSLVARLGPLVARFGPLVAL